MVAITSPEQASHPAPAKAETVFATDIVVKGPLAAQALAELLRNDESVKLRTDIVDDRPWEDALEVAGKTIAAVTFKMKDYRLRLWLPPFEPDEAQNLLLLPKNDDSVLHLQGGNLGNQVWLVDGARSRQVLFSNNSAPLHGQEALKYVIDTFRGTEDHTYTRRKLAATS